MDELKMQLAKKLRPLLKCQQGSVAIVASIAMTALVFGAGMAVDYGSMVSIGRVADWTTRRS